MFYGLLFNSMIFTSGFILSAVNTISSHLIFVGNENSAAVTAGTSSGIIKKTMPLGICIVKINTYNLIKSLVLKLSYSFYCH